MFRDDPSIRKRRLITAIATKAAYRRIAPSAAARQHEFTLQLQLFYV